MYIKLECNGDFVVTIPDPIRRGDDCAQEITFLLPKQVGEINMATATVYLSYIRADETADIDLLIRNAEDYNENYYSYTWPITGSMTRFSGEIRMWLQIFDGPGDRQMIAKSGECLLYVRDSMNMDEYITDRDISALSDLLENIKG